MKLSGHNDVPLYCPTILLPVLKILKVFSFFLLSYSFLILSFVLSSFPSLLEVRTSVGTRKVCKLVKIQTRAFVRVNESRLLIRKKWYLRFSSGTLHTQLVQERFTEENFRYI